VLHPLPAAQKPWENISIDLIGPLPPSFGHNAILVIVDYHTKMKILTPTTTELNARGTAEIYCNKCKPGVLMDTRYLVINSIITGERRRGFRD
jgi:hypothetical protein